MSIEGAPERLPVGCRKNAVRAGILKPYVGGSVQMFKVQRPGIIRASMMDSPMGAIHESSGSLRFSRLGEWDVESVKPFSKLKSCRQRSMQMLHFQHWGIVG